jgi:hypothetical protein
MHSLHLSRQIHRALSWRKHWLTSAATTFRLFALGQAMAVVGLQAAAPFDIVIRNGTVYDGSGGPAHVADVASWGQIVAIGALTAAVAGAGSCWTRRSGSGAGSSIC